ncbi:hypothetical protein AC249_AIPGENE14485, partial [Exaiptasia diaphana]
MNSINSTVTIPFVIISKDKGDSLINEINTGNDVVVAFGDKTGISTSDVGVYKEYALWSRWGTYPIGYLYLPDERFGAWVFNHGTTDQTNLALELWFSIASNSANDTTFTSPSFSLNAGDSVFIDFNFPFMHNVDTLTATLDTLNYGYNIIGATDSDTLDNTISNYVLGNGRRISQTYISTEDFSKIDYFLSFSENSPQVFHYIVNDRGNIQGISHDPRCLEIPRLAISRKPPEVSVEMHVGGSVEISNWDGTSFLPDNFLSFDDFQFNSVTGDSVFIEPLGHLGPYDTPMSVTILDMLTAVNLGYTSDMYFDEIYRQTGIANYMHFQLDGTSPLNIVHETYITPVFFAEAIVTGGS